MAGRGNKRSAPDERAVDVTVHAPGPGDDQPAAGEPLPGGQPTTIADRRFDAILRALPTREIDALIERMAIRIDTNKRIDKPAQVARALVRLPEVREPSRLPPASVELLRRIADASGALTVAALPVGVEALVRRGLVYARVAGDRVELVLPTALLVQLPSWESEDPRSIRALLADAPFETASAIASHYLGRPSTPPIALSLEPAWEVLGDPAALRCQIARVSHQERRLLEQLEQVGGEVDTQELMDLEREPMRVRGSYGVAAGRRGAAFSLEKRGLLYPVHPNRYLVPTEVAAIIGASGREAREEHRASIRTAVVADDHLPRRARFSAEPAPLAVALAMAVREADAEVRPGLGTPRSLVSRLAQRFGRDLESIALLMALSRAVGLWEPGVVSRATPPGSGNLLALSQQLFDSWRRGGAWDEARPEPETLRIGADQRDPSPVGVLREMVLGALQDLGEGQWVAYSALRAYLGADPRAPSLERLMTRWARRVGVSPPTPLEVARRILVGSLPALGVLDLGGPDVESAGSGELSGLALRLTARGRSYLAGTGAQEPGTQSVLVEPRTLRVGTTTCVADAMELTAFADVTAVDPALEVAFGNAALARGLGLGVSAAEMQRRVEALVAPSDELREAFEQAGTVVGRASLAPSSGFLWIEDENVRELLRTRQPAAELFVDPSPPAGLLLALGVDYERVVRRCRALGVEVTVEEAVMRVRRSTIPPPKHSETNRRSVSWRPVPGGGHNRSAG
jgi:hypothetical protein